jgi:ATPases of the AAA+ class
MGKQMKKSLEAQLTQYIEAGFPILYINTSEEEKADAAIRQTAAKIRWSHLTEWNGSRMVNFNTKAPMGASDDTLQGVLALFLEETAKGRLLILKEPQAQWENPECVALLRDVALRITTERLKDCAVIIVSSSYELPQEIEHYVTVLENEALTYEQIANVIQAAAEEWEAKLEQDALDEMITALKGLTESEIQNILRLAYHQYSGVLDRKAMTMILEQKRQTIKKSGILEMVEVNAGMNDVGGLANLKKWLERKASIFKNLQAAQAFGVDMPKGVLIAGVPGCGKSLSAKATAALLNVPLLRLDMGRLLGKYVGESEANMRKAISLAEAISPCVLWIDEMEKAFAGVGGEGGGAEVTTRLLGSFLTWLQEKEAPVFVVATANDILKLPSELLRKGRFDEIFYVKLPNRQERAAILEIHVRKRRKQDLPQINVPALAAETEGYSGADLEGVVKDSIEAAFAAGKDHVGTEDIKRAIRETQPLSEIMKESLDKMQGEYEKRKYKSAS